MKLKSARLERGITQKQLADILELSVAAVSSYETGSNYPSIEVLIKICRYFGISADYMIGLSDRKQFNMIDLTDEQYRTITSVITQFRTLNSLIDLPE